MNYLIEIHFYVKLTIDRIYHDSPNIGLYETKRVREESFGPFDAHEEAEEKRGELIKEGYRSNVSRDVYIEIIEKEITRKPLLPTGWRELEPR
ncbi:MAG: hypothetical protein WDZ40_01355 [Candidatus Spechtbacterales bacterium]